MDWLPAFLYPFSLPILFIYLIFLSLRSHIVVMKKKGLQSILFLDIETAAVAPQYEDLAPRMQEHWEAKAKRITYDSNMSPEQVAQLYLDKAAIYAEYSKIICISVAIIDYVDDEAMLKVKSYYGDYEAEILSRFAALLDKHFHRPDKHYLCGHNIREFDIPVLCRRMIIQGQPLPKLLQIGGKKPWQIEYLFDTLQMWKFGDYKSFVSLDLLSAVLGVPSPKNEMKGSEVSHSYWHEDGLEKIMQYCQQDVIATANVFLRLKGIEPIEKVKYIS